jgi:hypothetical protein
VDVESFAQEGWAFSTVEGINSIVTGNLSGQELVDCSPDGNLTSDEEEETWGRAGQVIRAAIPIPPYPRSTSTRR